MLEAEPIRAGCPVDYYSCAQGTTTDKSLLSTAGVYVSYSVLCSIHVPDEISWGTSSGLHLT